MLHHQEVDGGRDSDGPSTRRNNNDGARASVNDGFTFNTSLASSHTYLGEFDDTHGGRAFVDGGAVVKLPLFCLEGVVLFPEAALPLRVIQPRYIAAAECALNQADAPNTIGVVCVQRHPDDGSVSIASVGTTAEIRQFRRLADGSLNVVARGRMRFILRRHWVDFDGVLRGEIKICQEDPPLRTPKEAFVELASVHLESSSFRGLLSSVASSVKHCRYMYLEDDMGKTPSSNGMIDKPGTDLAVAQPDRYATKQELPGDKYYGTHELLCKQQSCLTEDKHSSGSCRRKSRKTFEASLSFWPRWSYEMYDSYLLAKRAADLWRQVIAKPCMDDYVKKPDVLSFYIGSKLPVSESTRQELLEIDGVSYRLQREIQLLKAFNQIRCKICLAPVANRSDMIVMSNEGPSNAYVNEHGFVHDTLTFLNADRLSLSGHPTEQNSWFPGYAWTIANCSICGNHMGWRFTAARENLLPQTFWGISGSRISDDTHA